MAKPGQFVLAAKKNGTNQKIKKKQKLKKQPKEVPKTIKKFLNNVKSGKLKKKNNKVPAELMPSKKFKVKNVQNDEKCESFQDKLANSLKASRFRFINELLYTNKSEQATSIVTQDPEAFKTYHEGYRHQVTQWPINPLDRIIKSVKAL